MDDAQLETLLLRHPHASGVHRVVAWLRSLAAPLRVRALSCYAAGLAPQELCAACRREVPATAGDPVAAADCVRCAARTVGESLAAVDRRQLAAEGTSLGVRLGLEAERGARASRPAR